MPETSPHRKTTRVIASCLILAHTYVAMNITKAITAISFAFAILSAPIMAESCCDKAKAAGKACAHPCCVEAKAKGEICKKCNK
jgi:hypothetical protein